MITGILAHELVIDNFAGGGGASEGIERALGRPIDIAINHDGKALAMHAANHPKTRHVKENVWDVDIEAVTEGRPVGLAWFSPDCKHFSKAKGGKPVSKKIRGLAWIVRKWARIKKPRVIVLENVEEFKTWGPLVDNKPCPRRKGRTFKRWVASLCELGYTVDWRELRACDYGAPTIRKRLFVVARLDMVEIPWPQETHGKGLLPYRTAAECIDWNIPCPSIFLNKKEARKLGINRPLVDNTMARIARGLKRYVIDSPAPFIVNMSHGGKVEPINKPISTIATEKGGCRALVVPMMSQYYGANRPGGDRIADIQEPLRTQPTENRHALVAAFFAKHFGGHETPGASLVEPSPTATAKDHTAVVTAHIIGVGGSEYAAKPKPVDVPFNTVITNDRLAIVTSNLVKLRGTCKDGQPVDEPAPTFSAQGTHVAEVRAFLLKYFGTDQDPRLEEPMHTVTSKHRFGLVLIYGELYEIVDIGMRMLTPRELFRAQGFADSYIIDGGRDVTSTQGFLLPGCEWIPLNTTEQVRMVGNSVCPPVAEAVIRAQFGLLDMQKEAA